MSDDSAERLAESAELLGERAQEFSSLFAASGLGTTLRRARVRSWVAIGTAVLALAGVGLGGFAWHTALRSGDRTTCAVRGVLTLAQSSTARNPIPPGLPPELAEAVQRSRDQATDLYTQALALTKGPRCSDRINHPAATGP